MSFLVLHRTKGSNPYSVTYILFIIVFPFPTLTGVVWFEFSAFSFCRKFTNRSKSVICVWSWSTNCPFSLNGLTSCQTNFNWLSLFDIPVLVRHPRAFEFPLATFCLYPSWVQFFHAIYPVPLSTNWLLKMPSEQKNTCFLRITVLGKVPSPFSYAALSKSSTCSRSCRSNSFCLKQRIVFLNSMLKWKPFVLFF